MATTLRDISHAVSLSTAAVSLVLNNKPNRISPAKQVLIRETAERLHYQPNQNAVGLVKRQSKTFGVIIPDIRNLFFSEIVSGIDKTALEQGWNIIITNSNDKYEIDLRNIRMLTSRDVDAIIMILASDSNTNIGRAYMQALSNFGKPVVLVDRYVISLETSTVAVNHQKGAYIAMQHLLGLGHTKIACISGPYFNSLERLQGVRIACIEHGLAFDEKDVFEGTYTMEAGYDLADAIIEGSYTAVFSFNDMMAYGLYKRLRERKIHVPQDISLVGFDDIFFSDYLDLTTVTQPAYALGVEAAERAFFEIINPTAKKQSIFFEPVLQIRKSTAPVKSAVKIIG